MKILGIAGSLRAGSYNRQLLQLAADNLPDGAELVVWEGLRDLPAFDEDAEGTPSLAVAGFRAAVADADAVLIATPEYNGSIPGALKNALDWGSRPRETAAFRSKPVAVIGASEGMLGAARASRAPHGAARDRGSRDRLRARDRPRQDAVWRGARQRATALGQPGQCRGVDGAAQSG